jgi:hypothetical protein
MLAAPGCATSASGRVRGAGHAKGPDATLLGEYVRSLPLGSAVRVERAGGGNLRGTLLRATDRSVVIQPLTRIPEPPIEIPVTELLSVTPGSAGRGVSIGKAIAAGAAAGAGGALAVFLILVAVYSD